MSYQSVVLKDNPLGFWPLDESSGDTAYDISPCGNHGSYNFGISSFSAWPLTQGGNHSTIIDSLQSVSLPFSKGYTSENSTFTIADKYSFDNDFSLEIWIHPKSLNSLTNIFYSDYLLPSNNYATAIYYENNAIYFNVNDIKIGSYLENLNESVHIVATYSPNNMSLYLNGKLKATKTLSNFTFINDSFLTFIVGPTNSSSEKMLINSAALYKYQLSEQQILNHYEANKTIPASQIVFPEEGILFSGSDFGVRKIFEYSYPTNKRFDELKFNSSFYYDKQNNCILLNQDVTEDTFFDSFSIPEGLDIISSKVEWDYETNIDLFVSETGEDGSYIQVENGKPLPGFIIGNSPVSDSKTIYFSIT